MTITWPPPAPTVPVFPPPEGEQPWTAPDFVTVLTTFGPAATKQITRLPSGEYRLTQYGSARNFDIRRLPIRNLQHLINEIDRLQCRAQSFIVHGAAANGYGYQHAPRRVRDRRNSTGEVEPATLAAAEHFWIPIDVDGFSCPRISIRSTNQIKWLSTLSAYCHPNFMVQRACGSSRLVME